MTESLSPEPMALSHFPKSPAEFDSDPRVSFSKLDNKYILETEDGEEYTYDDALKRWIPSLDDALVEQQREVYKVQGVDEDEPATAKAQREKRKRKHPTNDNETLPTLKGRLIECTPKGSTNVASHKPKKPRVNTAVYVTSVPLDASSDEVRDVFSKCGVIAEEIDSGRPRIKMYTDEQGNFKGDALVVYFRPESVNLAVQMLDDSDFRFGETGPQGRMKVQPADFSFKAQQEAPSKPSTRDKMKIMKKTQKLNNKLTDWDDDEAVPTTQSSKWEKIVVLKHMFTLAELEEDPAAILDIKEDIREECSKLGEVTNVVLYDKEASGVATVRFSDPEAAKACVQMMRGRFFGGTQVEAYISDGQERFRKSGAKQAIDLEDGGEGWEVEQQNNDEAKRLDQFGSWLEKEKSKGQT
ncbi:hypothetical protein FQN57_003795 [Myotisia sp. PD_48]|nr:hypothetical protein FQN57_003795 [Myotisia sp. PD_48]